MTGSTGPPDAVVVGGGVIGLAIAWQAAEAGLHVALVDDQPGRAASHAAAGMLAPVTEVHYGEEALLRLNLSSARRYPSFVAALEEAAGTTVGYHSAGTLMVAADDDDAAALGELERFQHTLGLDAQRLRRRECRALEPLLGPRVRAGLHAEGDQQVDNRRLTAALLEAGARRGVDLHRQRVTSVVVDRDRAQGVILTDGSTLGCRAVVVAAGCWSARLAGIPPEARPPVRPVKGQILRLRGPAGTAFLAQTVRGIVHGASVYLVPREDGEIVVGATVEERGFDTTVTAGAVHELLRDAHEIVPGISELELAESLAGLRPGSPDNAPLIGPTAIDGLVMATGHFRNGILLAPATADAVSELLTTGCVPQAIKPFSPERFARAPATNAVEEPVS
jgi:glycine oxidase